MSRADLGRNLVHAADHNMRLVLDAVRRAGSQTRSDLTELTSLSLAGIGNILAQLEGAGLVERRSGPSKSQTYSLVETARSFIGIDVSPQGNRAVLIDLAGSVLREVALAADDLEGLRNAVHELARLAGTALAGCGMAIPETFDHRTVLPDESVGGLHLGTIYTTNAVGAVTLTCHDRSVVGVPFACLWIAGSIVAGYVFEGRLLHGSNGAAGRLGLMRINGIDRTLNDIAGLEAIPDGLLSCDAELDRYRPWFDDVVPPLVDAIVTVWAFLAPAVINVGGRLPVETSMLLRQRLSSEAQQRAAFHIHRDTPQIKIAPIEQCDVAYGAALLPLYKTLLPDLRS